MNVNSFQDSENVTPWPSNGQGMAKEWPSNGQAIAMHYPKINHRLTDYKRKIEQLFH